MTGPGLLAQAPWLRWPELQALCDVLEPQNMRIVGGAVRDQLLQAPVSDVDIATPLLPDVVMARLRAHQHRVIPTGLAHGTITALIGQQRFEITTLRRDVETDGRHARVEFSTQWADDAARRDFTVNALYCDVDGVVYDYFSGLADLAARRVRFIGDARVRITEDALRILRFFRFTGRLGGGRIDPQGLAACAALNCMQMSLSRERVRDELLKILALADPVPIVRAMLANDILTPVLPELTDLAKLADVCLRQAGIMNFDPLVRLAALAPPSLAALSNLAPRLRLSNKETARLIAMATPRDLSPDSDFALHFYRAGVQTVLDQALLSGASTQTLSAVVTAGQAWVRPPMPVRGQQLIDRGVALGPEVSRLLQVFEQHWSAAGFPQDGPRVEQLVQQTLAQPSK